MTECLIGRGLTFDYGAEPALDGADVTVRPGRATALVGASGSGKSTLLWLMAGLLRPTRGRVAVLSEADAQTLEAGAAADSSQGAQFPSAVGRMGMVFQNGGLWDHLCVEDHLAVVLSPLGLTRAERRRRIGQALDRMGLVDLRRRRPGELSGGQGQRLALARAVVVEPRWLLLDEPLAHLDGPARAELLDLLRDVLCQTQAGALLATHHAGEALGLADEVVVLADGRVVQSGPPETVYRRPVSLVAARTLGPASQLEGQAANGQLIGAGQTILDGLALGTAGPTQIIVRPQDVEFCVDSDGPARVVTNELVGCAYQVTVTVAGRRVIVHHAFRLAAATSGRLRLRRDRPACV